MEVSQDSQVTSPPSVVTDVLFPGEQQVHGRDQRRRSINYEGAGEVVQAQESKKGEGSKGEGMEGRALEGAEDTGMSGEAAPATAKGSDE